MLCPLCLAEVTFKAEAPKPGAPRVYLCPSCSQPIPALYLKDYRDYPPVVVSAVGFRQHGKSVYFAALFHLLKRMRMARHWPKFFTMGLDEESLQTVYDNVNLLEKGRLPEATPTNFPRPTMVRVEGIPQQPNSTLVCYDTGGESFQKPSQMIRHARFVQRAKTAMFLVSVPDLTDPGREMHQLLNTYAVGMAELQGETKHQHLSVVFTKADQMGERLTRWEDIYAYLRDGSAEAVAMAPQYMTRLEQISHRLRDFTRQELEADEFLNAAESQFRSVNFSIVSALGARPQGDQLAVQISPRRVLDPIFWMMSHAQTPWQRWRRRWLRRG